MRNGEISPLPTSPAATGPGSLPKPSPCSPPNLTPSKTSTSCYWPTSAPFSPPPVFSGSSPPTLVHCLAALPNRIGVTISGNHSPLNQTSLACRLRRFHVRSHNVRIGNDRAKGYDLADFAQPFALFLDNQSPISDRPRSRSRRPPTPVRPGTPVVRLRPHRPPARSSKALHHSLAGPGTPRGTLPARLLVRLKSQKNLGKRGLGTPVRLN